MLGCVTQCLQSAAHSCEQFLQVQSCIIVTLWSGAGGIQALSERSTGLLQCFDTVGLVR